MEASESPTAYRVVYSCAVEQRLRELSEVAKGRGDGPAFVAALKAFRDRLPIYPQFGDPLYDLTAESGQIYTGLIPPIAMRYGVFEDRRLVFCGSLPILMPMASPDASADE
jgi:hypothetical protein